jgi:hypothetical protein
VHHFPTTAPSTLIPAQTDVRTHGLNIHGVPRSRRIILQRETHRAHKRLGHATCHVVVERVYLLGSCIRFERRAYDLFPSGERYGSKMDILVKLATWQLDTHDVHMYVKEPFDRTTQDLIMVKEGLSKQFQRLSRKRRHESDVG